jgi:hypothetical protein
MRDIADSSWKLNKAVKSGLISWQDSRISHEASVRQSAFQVTTQTIA